MEFCAACSERGKRLTICLSAQLNICVQALAGEKPNLTWEQLKKALVEELMDHSKERLFGSSSEMKYALEENL